MLDPDPALPEAWRARGAAPGRARSIHRLAISGRERPARLTIRDGPVRVSRLADGATEATLPWRRPCGPLCPGGGGYNGSILKSTAECWDFESLRSHDFAGLPPGQL